jgi:hypothetical protein
MRIGEPTTKPKTRFCAFDGAARNVRGGRKRKAYVLQGVKPLTAEKKA